MARSNEPLVWSLFSAGGVVTAFVTPAVVLVLSGWFGTKMIADPAFIAAGLAHPLIAGILLGFLVLSFFHAAHRLRFVIFDFGLHSGVALIATLCYGAALAASALAVKLLFFA